MNILKGKKIITRLIIVIVIFIAIIYSVFSNNKDKSISQTYFYMGTVIDITLFETDDQSHLSNISTIINDLDKKLSRNIETSEIYKINNLAKNESLKLSDDTYNIIKSSLYYSDLSKGYFDITINPLVMLWGIGTESANVPSEENIKKTIKKIDYKNIMLNNNVITLLSEDTSIDLGAIAKGYVADKIVEYLKDNNIDKALINLGGNVYAHGSSTTSKPWNIGIRDPENKSNGPVLKVMLENKSVVTSGSYERFFEEDGIIYHHILNPFDGYPVNNDILSISIISDKSIDGDALSTSLYCLGTKEALNIAKSLENIELIIITKDKKIYITNGIKNNFKLFDKSFEIIISKIPHSN